MKKASSYYSFLPNDFDDGGGGEVEEEGPSPQKKIRIPNLKSVLGTRKIFTVSSLNSSSSSSGFSSLMMSSSTSSCSPPVSSSSSSSSVPATTTDTDFASFRNVLYSKLEPKFRNRSKAGRYQLFGEIKEELFSKIFLTLRMDDCDAKDFLNYAMRDLDNTDVGNERKQQQVQEDIFNSQLKSLSLVERNQLYRLLTHEKPQQEGADGEEAIDWTLNEDMLGLFPFLRKRSSMLLNYFRDGRKSREDKIDLQFISDFMHNYCRFVLMISFILCSSSATYY